MQRNIKLSEIARELNLKWSGNDRRVNGLNLCDRQSKYGSIISYVTNERYVEYVKNFRNIVCLVLDGKFLHMYGREAVGRTLSYIISDNPEKTFYGIHEYLYKKTDFYERYDFLPKIGKDCEIDDRAVIQKGVIIGNRVKISPLTVIKSGSVIEDDVEIGCNTVIGSEGFQIITDCQQPPMHIHHVGGCHISSNVYIGDNTCICNSLFEGATEIGECAKIDNLVHVAHNITIEKDAVVTACVILCGSSELGEGSWIAPNASVLNRTRIGKGAKVGMGSTVVKDVPDNALVYGVPAKEKNRVGR